ncbi:TSC22 domain family protein 4-like [Phasianus colchicus]|uniref:TSC22 domain family protein 4-like n=1 Tax=Phasianus colchicus TaxID=9054 RepID=UPI00129E03BB|nr:TSC22 domain family protein 4-like [Phasianus colchicus]
MSRKRSGFAITSVRGGGAGSDPEAEHAEPGAPGPSRFRLVRLPAAGETLRRGRWICRDFYEREAAGSVRVPLSLGSAPQRPAQPGPAQLPRSWGHDGREALPRPPPPPPHGHRPGGGTEGLSARLGLAGAGIGEDGSSSGVSAIDNKIEQAMDLVKSHLLLAVREEVELLREQIKELSERRAVLERENGALRAIATPQQLARLQPPPP